MQRTETVTAVGEARDERGTLYVRLVTAVERRANRVGDAEHTVVRFEIHEGRDAANIRLLSLFGDADERDDVAHRIHPTVAFARPVGTLATPRVLPFPPNLLVGRSVSAFRRAMPPLICETSLTIEFGSSVFIALYWPELRKDEHAVAGDDPRYFDHLCRLVGAKLLLLDEFIDEGLFLEFSDATTLSITPPPNYDPEYCGRLATVRGPGLDYDWWGPYGPFAPPDPHSMIDWWR